MNNQSHLTPSHQRPPALLWNGWIACLATCLLPAALLPMLSAMDLRMVAAVIRTWIRSAHGLFASWAGPESVGWNLLPAALTLTFAAVARLLFDRPPDCLRLPVALIFLTLQVSYLSFRLFATLCFDTWADGMISLLFFLSESFIHLRIALGNFSLLKISDHSDAANESQQCVRAQEFLPTVDIFVPTYSEPVEMLRRTIIGCQAIDYPNKTVYLLDDQRRPAMRALAAELGCQYFDRPDNRHAKAGNLNHALPRTEGELILCFDADFVPCRDFLERTVGFFRDPTVAMVQTPQNFFNEDAVTRNLGLEHALEDEQRLFFRTIQPGRDSANAVICHGSCFVMRRSAVASVGGIPTETITEDWATSIKLQAAGYRIIYLNEALSAGVSADKCGEFVQQRARWCQGTLQALFASTNPLRVSGLGWRQRIIHFTGIVYYLGSLTMLFNLVAPLFFLFFGTHLLRMTVPEMLFYRVPFTIGFYLLYSWLSCGNRSALWTELYEVFLAPSMGLTVLRTLVKPFGAAFRVTDKVLRPGKLMLNRRVATPFIVLIVLHLVGIAFSILMNRHMEERDGFFIVAYFAAWNIALLWMCVLISIDVAQRSPFVRFARQLNCVVTWEDTGVTLESCYLSEGDVVLQLAGSNPPDMVDLHFPDLGLADVSARFKERPLDGQAVFEFLDLSLQQRRLLVEYLFCQPSQWDRPPRSEVKAAWEYLRAGLRMYPLAESV